MANTVLAGDYSGLISFKGDKKGLLITENKFFGAKKTFINKTTVDHYELVMQEGNSSMGSGVARGAVGAALFGGIGAIAGANSAKKNSDYTVSIIFNGKARSHAERAFYLPISACISSAWNRSMSLSMLYSAYSFRASSSV